MWLASKEMFFATCFILNLAHTHKRPVNKLMAAFNGVFLSLFHKNIRRKSLFNIKLCNRFYIYLSRLIINLNSLKKYFFVCDDHHSYEYASNARSFND